jgi:hypothetical protein
MKYNSAEYRFEKNGNFYKVYKLDGNAYVFQCQIPLQGNSYNALKRAYELYLNVQNLDNFEHY